MTSVRKLSSAIVLLASLMASNAEANLLTAGDFESGTLGTLGSPVANQWLQEINATLTGPTNGVTPFGTQMLEIGDAIGGSVAQVRQQVVGSFVAGTTVSFNVLLNAFGTGVTATLFLAGKNSLTFEDDTETFLRTNFVLDNDVNTWQSVNVTGVLGANANGLAAEIRFFNSTLELGGRTGYADNAVLTATAPVPEPTSIILFGYGLLGLAAWGRFKKNA